MKIPSIGPVWKWLIVKGATSFCDMGMTISKIHISFNFQESFREVGLNCSWFHMKPRSADLTGRINIQVYKLFFFFGSNFQMFFITKQNKKTEHIIEARSVTPGRTPAGWVNGSIIKPEKNQKHEPIDPKF